MIAPGHCTVMGDGLGLVDRCLSSRTKVKPHVVLVPSRFKFLLRRSNHCSGLGRLVEPCFDLTSARCVRKLKARFFVVGANVVGCPMQLSRRPTDAVEAVAGGELDKRFDELGNAICIGHTTELCSTRREQVAIKGVAQTD